MLQLPFITDQEALEYVRSSFLHTRKREEKVHAFSFHFNIHKSQTAKREIGSFFLRWKPEYIDCLLEGRAH